MTHSYFQEPPKRFKPSPRHYKHWGENERELSSIGDMCFQCNKPIEECEGHE